jgi:hypothetical protein
MIRFHCDCGRLLQAKEEYVGRRSKCPDCGLEQLVPAVSEVVDSSALSADERTRWADGQEGEAGADALAGTRPTRTSGKAVASLFLGIASLVLVILAGIPAIILGIMGLREVSQGRGRVRGKGLALTGMILGVIGSALTVVLAVAGVGLMLRDATVKVREAANRTMCSNNLKQIAIAMHNYHDVHGRLPPAVVRDKAGKPLYSWRVLVLPYLEADDLYKQFHLDEPWDSPHNRSLLSQMPRVFRDPSSTDPDPGATVYQVFVGPKTGFESPQGETLLSFTDGTSNTVLVVEAATAVPWTQPVDLPYDPKGPLPELGGHHTVAGQQGFNVAMADGSVHYISDSIDETLLRAMITRNGGENVTPP